MNDPGFVIDFLRDNWTLFLVIAALVVALYRVNVIHKTVYGEHGELLLMTKKEGYYMLANCQKDRDPKIAELNKITKEPSCIPCEYHEEHGKILSNLVSIQTKNVEKHKQHDIDIKESKQNRELIQIKLDNLNSNIATLLERTKYLGAGERRTSEREI